MASTALPTTIRYCTSSLKRTPLVKIKFKLKPNRNFDHSNYFVTSTSRQLAHNNIVFDATKIQSLHHQAWFSNIAPKSGTNLELTQESIDENNFENSKPVSPRYILSTLPQPFTPGQALFKLQKKGADGSLISKSDVTQLCEASRSGVYRDALVIKNAIIQFHTCWKFRLKDPTLATKICDSMIRSVLQTEKKNAIVEEVEYTPESKMKAGLFVAKVFNKRESRLYYTTTQTDVEKFLSLLWEGLKESHSQSKTKEEDNLDRDDEKEKTPQTKMMRKEEPAKLAALYLMNPNPRVPNRYIKKRTRYALKRIFGNMCLPKSQLEENSNAEVLKVTREVFHTLLIRSSRAETRMKKKARMKYLQRLVVKDGPNLKITELVTKICGLLGGSRQVIEIVQMWEKKLNMGKTKKEYENSPIEGTEGLWAIVSELEEKEKMGEENASKESMNGDHEQLEDIESDETDGKNKKLD